MSHFDISPEIVYKVANIVVVAWFDIMLIAHTTFFELFKLLLFVCIALVERRGRGDGNLFATSLTRCQFYSPQGCQGCQGRPATP